LQGNNGVTDIENRVMDMGGGEEGQGGIYGEVQRGEHMYTYG